MMKPTLYYCFDAYCGWCYGFSKSLKNYMAHFGSSIEYDALNGGMMLPEKPVHIGQIANYIAEAYLRVEQTAGVKFGEDYLWHIFNPDESDWFPHSLPPAKAHCFFKKNTLINPIQLASDIQYALHEEGRDLTDPEAYRHLCEKYGVSFDDFLMAFESETYEEAARYDFALVKQLQVTGFPALLLQTGPSQFYLLSRGYSHPEDLIARTDRILEELKA